MDTDNSAGKEDVKKNDVKKVVKKRVVKNSTKTNNKTKKGKGRKVFNGILITLLIIVVIGVLGVQQFHVDKLKQQIASLTIKLESTENELEKSKARIAGVKGIDDLLKRDIELYIRGTYKKVPKVIAQRIASIVVDLSKQEEVSPELLIGIIQVESQFNPMAVGPKTKYGNARGLMQIMPAWGKKFKLESRYDLHDVDINIVSGVKVFKVHLKENKGSISKALYDYVNKDKSYVDKVYNAMGRFVSFRSTIGDIEKSEEKNGQPITVDIISNNIDEKKETEKKNGSNDRTK